MSFSKLGSVVRGVTVEPIIFFFYWSLPYLNHGNASLLFNRFCTETYNDTVCQNSTTHKEANIHIQGETSRWIMYTQVVMLVPVLVTTTILGGLSDRLSRKIPMAIPSCGVLLGSLWLLTLAYVKHLDVRLILISSFLFGLSGYIGGMMTTTTAYIGTITKPHRRTWRLSITEASLTGGLVIGNLSSGIIIDHIGVEALYAIVAGLHLTTLIYIVVRIKETVAPAEVNDTSLIRQIFSASHFKEMLKVMYKKRQHSKRLYLQLSFAAFIVGNCSLHGLFDVLFLYLTKARGFTNTLFSAYMGVAAVLNTISSILIMWFLRRRLQLTEPFIMMLASTSVTLAFGMLSSTSHAVIWSSLVFIGVMGLGFGAGRGFLSKLVSEDEQGQLFAFVAMGQSVAQILASLAFNNFYPLTLRFWDGSCVILASLMNVVVIVLAGVVCRHRKTNKFNDLTHLVDHVDEDAELTNSTA